MTSLRITIAFLVQNIRCSLVCRKYPDNYKPGIPVEFRDKAVLGTIHRRILAGAGSILRKQGTEMEKVGWVLTGMFGEWKQVIDHDLSSRSCLSLVQHTVHPVHLLVYCEKQYFSEGVLLAVFLKSFQVHQ